MKFIILPFFAVLSLTINIFAQQNWNGTWEIKYRHSSSTLDITQVSKNKLKFSISAFSGAHEGEISGSATISGKTANFIKRDKTVNEICKLKFAHTGKTIKVEQSGCQSYGGVGVYFGGEYKKGKQVLNDSLITFGIFPDKKTDQGFRQLVGKDYENFLDNLQLIAEDENKDTFPAKAFSGFVRGLAPFNAAIIMFDNNYNYWAAYIEIDDNDVAKIHYFSNAAEWKNKLPQTINAWAEEKRQINRNLQIIFRSKDK